MMLIAAFIWAYFGKIDTYVIATGEIRSAETPSTITLRNGGKIANIIIADGAFVHEGDAIIELDKDYYEKQQSLLDEQIAKKESDIANYQQLIKSIQNDDNMFHESRDPVFYYQYENYRLELEAANKKIAATNDQVSATSKGYELAIDYAADNLKSVQVLYKEYQALYAAVESGGTYTGANQTVTSAYNSYKSSLDKARITYSAYEEAYTQLLREYELSGTGSTPSESENETMPDPNDMFPEKPQMVQQITNQQIPMSQKRQLQAHRVTLTQRVPAKPHPYLPLLLSRYGRRNTLWTQPKPIWRR